MYGFPQTSITCDNWLKNRYEEILEGNKYVLVFRHKYAK